MNLPNMIEAKKRTNKEVSYYEYKSSEYSLNNKKFYLRTYGCQMNIHDSEKIRGILIYHGAIETKDLESADIVILNTCAIRENAHDKVFGFLGKIKSIKKNKPDLILGICGCMAQEENVVKEIMTTRNYVNFVIGTHNIDELIPIIEKCFKENKTNIEVYSIEGNVCEDFPHVRDSKYTAWVDIQLGCDKFCTYCIVPYTRGKQRSRKKEEIINEIIRLKNNGYKEVTLLGQNVNAYGKDLYDNYNLSNLLKDVSETGIERIRFVTSHPWDFTDSMIEVISECENVMPYIHLPIQSGSNRILKLMGRRYTKEEYLSLYDKIRTKVKNSSITTDIIVGFPGETEEDFLETLDVVEKCKFDGAFTFIFSPRENTPASLMKNFLSESEKKDRLKRLNTLVNKYSNISNKKYLNKEVKCLITGLSEKENSKLCGYTEDMKLVNIVGDKKYIGQIVQVKITETKSFSMNGEIVLVK